MGCANVESKCGRTSRGNSGSPGQGDRKTKVEGAVSFAEKFKLTMSAMKANLVNLKIGCGMKS
jgi:hypothetical protein